MRQKIKYGIQFSYFLSILLFIHLSFKKTSFLIPAFVTNLLLLTSVIDGFYLVVFYPKLGKRIVHESGTYYSFCGKSEDGVEQFIICRDYLFFKISIMRIIASSVNNSDDLKSKIKIELDIKSKKVISKFERIKVSKKILQEMDEYISNDIKRDDKIKKILR